MAETTVPDSGAEDGDGGETRRDFLTLAAYTMSAWGAAAAGVAFIDSMNPAADILAQASTEVDLSPIEEGQAITVLWRGTPVFVRNRTPEEIEAARDVKMSALPDPAEDSDRVKEGDANWLVLVGVCTHLGCVPLGQKSGDNKGDYGGWFCPCHGSHYDTSGRIRKGPAPINLVVPPYEFQTDTYIKIG